MTGHRQPAMTASRLQRFCRTFSTLLDHFSIREISRRTGLSRNTVRKYLRSDSEEPKFSVPDRPSKLDPHADKLSHMLRQEAGKSRKQKRTIKQLHADLVMLGYEGCRHRRSERGDGALRATPFQRQDRKWTSWRRGPPRPVGRRRHRRHDRRSSGTSGLSRRSDASPASGRRGQESAPPRAFGESARASRRADRA